MEFGIDGDNVEGVWVFLSLKFVGNFVIWYVY